MSRYDRIQTVLGGGMMGGLIAGSLGFGNSWTAVCIGAAYVAGLMALGII